VTTTESWSLNGFIIKECLTILLPLLENISNLSISQQHFPTQWKQAIILPVYKKGNNASVQNCKPAFLLNNFSNVFKFVTHSQLSHYFKFKFNPYGFIKSKYTITNLMSHLDYISPLVCSLCQADTIYFDFSSVFDLIPHTFLLHKLSGPVDGYVSLLHGCIILLFKFIVFIQHLLKCLLVFPKDLSLGPCSSMYF
jgi:hypothetical protein